MDERPAVVLSDVKKSFPLAGGASLEVLNVGPLQRRRLPLPGRALVAVVRGEAHPAPQRSCRSLNRQKTAHDTAM
jgi:hypothetical protein